ncbi:MAG: hypothetical protein PSX81_12630 [bacterium]|nr:hypothetical protein [bacterium]
MACNKISSCTSWEWLRLSRRGGALQTNFFFAAKGCIIFSLSAFENGILDLCYIFILACNKISSCTLWEWLRPSRRVGLYKPIFFAAKGCIIFSLSAFENGIFNAAWLKIKMPPDGGI